jgi:hypothetical protein
MVKIQGGPPVPCTLLRYHGGFWRSRMPHVKGSFGKRNLAQPQARTAPNEPERSKKHGTNGALSGIKKILSKPVKSHSMNFAGCCRRPRSLHSGAGVERESSLATFGPNPKRSLFNFVYPGAAGLQGHTGFPQSPAPVAVVEGLEPDSVLGDSLALNDSFLEGSLGL